MKSARGPSVRIVGVNDVYSLENLPRLRTLVEHHRRTDPADLFLVTLAGDFVAPSILSSLDFGRAMVECMKLVGVTHAIFGNHEDDIPIEALRSRITELGATFLSTNVAFDPPLPASQVLQVGRVRIGLVGVVMTDEATYRRPPFGGGKMLNANEAARAEAARLLRDERCTVVIPITHQTHLEDRALAHQQRDPIFPVIIGGHEHVVVLEQVEGTWIEKAGADAFHGADSDLVWPAEPPASGPDLPVVIVHMDDVAGYEEDVELRALVNQHIGAVRDLEEASLRSIPPGVTISSIGARRMQTTMGTLLCSSVREALGADGCLINGGGIRGSHEYRGRLTYADVKTEVPFDNEVVVARLPGRVVRDAISASRALAPAESGSFLQVDDGIIVDEHDVVTAIAGAPLDLDRHYEIALVRNLLSGLDRIEPLVTWANANPDHMPPLGSGRETKQIIVECFSIAIWRTLGGFDAVDTDNDGMVSEADVFAAMGDHPGRSHVTAKLIVAALDKNNDQAISREEARGLSARAKR